MSKAVGLPEWIRELGVVKVCLLTGSTAESVMFWKRGVTLPKDTTKVKIVQVAKGRVTYASMIQDHAKRHGWV